jgi:hypothetical protein
LRHDQSCLYRRGDYRNRGHNVEKLSLVQVPMKIFSVARKLCMAEERRQDQSCLFRRGDLQEQRPQPRKTALTSSPDEDCFSSSETTHDRTAQRTKLFVSARRLQELRSQTQKLSWVRASVKMLALEIIIIIIIIIFFSAIFNYAYRMIRPMAISSTVISFKDIRQDCIPSFCTNINNSWSRSSCSG